MLKARWRTRYVMHLVLPQVLISVVTQTFTNRLTTFSTTQAGG
jgi:hypothetical protein